MPPHLEPGTPALIAGSLLAVLCFARAARGVDWRGLSTSGRLNLWLGTTAALMVLWRLRAGAHPGLDVHLIGATVVYLMFGTRLAVVSLAIAALGAGLAAHEPMEVIGLHWLLWAGVPLLASASAVPWAERRLPAHPFVFLWGYGFVVSGLAVGASGLAQVLVYGVLQALPWPVLTDDYLPFFLLLGWSEAFTAGALLTLMVVWQPGWVERFDDAVYLRRR